MIEWEEFHECERECGKYFCIAGMNDDEVFPRASLFSVTRGYTQNDPQCTRAMNGSMKKACLATVCVCMLFTASNTASSNAIQLRGRFTLRREAQTILLCVGLGLHVCTPHG